MRVVVARMRAGTRRVRVFKASFFGGARVQPDVVLQELQYEEWSWDFTVRLGLLSFVRIAVNGG
jgi:hypothetical protein